MSKKLNIKYLRYLLGISIIVYLLFQSSTEKVYIALKGAEVGWFFLAMLVVISSSILGSVNQYLLVQDERIRYRKFMPVFWLGWAVSTVFPGQVGDLLTVSAWLRKRGLDYISILFVTISDKLITLIWMSAFAYWGWLIFADLDGRGGFDATLLNVFLISSGLSFAIFFIAFIRLNKSYPLKYLRYINHVKNRIISILINFTLTPIKITLVALSHWAMFTCYGVDLEFLTVLLFMALCSLVAYIPISFNGLGVVEWAAGYLYVRVGVDMEVTLVVILSLRISVFLASWLPCFAFWRETDQ